MKKSMVVFITLILTTLFLTIIVSANDIGHGILEGHAIQDGYIPLPKNEITAESFYAPQGNARVTKTLDDYTNTIIDAWSSYSEDIINISELNITTSSAETQTI